MDETVGLKGAIDETERATGRKILYAFLQGSQNYNLALDSSDIDIKAFCLPTFDDLYQERKFGKTIDHSFGQITLHDIRKLPTFLDHANPYYLESLASKLIFLDDSRPVSLTFIDQKEAFFQDYFSCRGLSFLSSLYGLAKKEREGIDKGGPSRAEVFAQYGYDPKAACHGLRYLSLFFSLQSAYLSQDSDPYSLYCDALRLVSPSERLHLLDIKQGKGDISLVRNELEEGIAVAGSFLDARKEALNQEKAQKAPCLEVMKKEIRQWVESLFGSMMSQKD